MSMPPEKQVRRPTATILAAALLVAVVAVAVWRHTRPPPPAGPTACDLLVLTALAEDKFLTRHRLLRYRFRDGVPGEPEVVWTGDAALFGSSRQKIQLVAGRYVITQNAGAIDLTTGEAILEERFADLLGVEEGKVYFHRRRAADSEAYGALDLATRQLQRLDEPGKWTLPGTRSPCGTKSVELQAFHSITLHRLGQEQRSLGDDFLVSYSRLSSALGRPPVLWLDETQVLTQLDNGKLVVVSAEDGRRGKPITFPATKEILSPPRLWRDANEDIVYECGPEAHRIDARAGTARRYDWRVLGHGFEMAMKADRARKHAIRHEGWAIGNLECQSWYVAVSEGHLAVLCEGGVWVWSARSRHWTLLDPEHPEAVIGWVP